MRCAARQHARITPRAHRAARAARVRIARALCYCSLSVDIFRNFVLYVRVLRALKKQHQATRWRNSEKKKRCEKTASASKKKKYGGKGMAAKCINGGKRMVAKNNSEAMAGAWRVSEYQHEKKRYSVVRNVNINNQAVASIA